MDVHRYLNVADLPPGVLEFLAEDDARNNVPYGVLKMMQKTPEAFKDYELFVVSEAGKIKHYAQRTPPYPPYLSLGEPKAVAALALHMKKAGVVLPGLLGEKSVTEIFLEHWPELKQQWTQVERQGFYRLETVTQPPLTGATFEKAKAQDAELYAAWLKAFCVELNDFYPGDEAARKMQNDRIAAGDLYCLSRDGKPKSMAVAGRRTIHGRCVAFVYTPPEERSKGYAAELVARLSQTILDEGAHYACLFTQLDNPVSNRIYQRMGYAFVCEFRKYT